MRAAPMEWQSVSAGRRRGSLRRRRGQRRPLDRPLGRRARERRPDARRSTPATGWRPAGTSRSCRSRPTTASAGRASPTAARRASTTRRRGRRSSRSCRGSTARRLARRVVRSLRLRRQDRAAPLPDDDGRRDARKRRAIEAGWRVDDVKVGGVLVSDGTLAGWGTEAPPIVGYTLQLVSIGAKHGKQSNARAGAAEERAHGTRSTRSACSGSCSAGTPRRWRCS